MRAQIIKNAPALYQQPGAWVLKKDLKTMSDVIRVHEFLEGRVQDGICPQCSRTDDAHGNYTVTYTGTGANQSAMLTVWHTCECGNRYAVVMPIRFSWMIRGNEATMIYPLAGMEDEYVGLLAAGFVSGTWADVRRAYADEIRASEIAKEKWMQREGVRV